MKGNETKQNETKQNEMQAHHISVYHLNIEVKRVKRNVMNKHDMVDFFQPIMINNYKKKDMLISSNIMCKL
jgi:hypothetical protein